MYTEITIVVLVIIILILLLSLFINSKNKQNTPWTRITYSLLQRLLLLKPNIIRSWIECSQYQYFPTDGYIVVVTDNPKGHAKIRPGAILYFGSAIEYDIFAVNHARILTESVYILNVEYLGAGSNKSGYELKYTL